MAAEMPGEFYEGETGLFWIRFPWFLAGAIVLVALILLIKGYWFWSVASLLLLLMFRFHVVESTNPPKFAVLKIWEKLARGVWTPGTYLTLPYFPFFMSFQEIERLYQELTFHFKDVPCLLVARNEQAAGDNPGLGGTFDAEIGIAIEPDHEWFLQYILSGGTSPSKNDNPETHTELQDLVWNNLVQAFQELGQHNTYEQVIFMGREQIGIFLINNLASDIKFEELSDDIDLTDCDQPDSVKKAIKKTYAEKVGPTPDIAVKKWGFKLPQFKVGPIRPHEDLQAEARDAAKELKTREKEQNESATLEEMIKDILKHSEDGSGNPTMSYADARKEARIQKGLTVETIDRKIYEGFDTAASAFGEALKGRGGNNGS